MKQRVYLLGGMFIVAVLLVLEYLFGVGFLKTWAIDCGCVGVKKYFIDERGIDRCSCYGVTAWRWLE